MKIKDDVDFVRAEIKAMWPEMDPLLVSLWLRECGVRVNNIVWEDENIAVCSLPGLDFVSFPKSCIEGI